MSEGMQEVTFEEAVVNRMAQRIGALSAQLDVAQVTIEMKDQQIAALTQQLQEATALAMIEHHEFSANGDSTVSVEGEADDLRQLRPDVPEHQAEQPGAQGSGARDQGGA